MNLALFEQAELDPPYVPGGAEAAVRYGGLSRRDQRAVHLIKVLHKKSGDRFDAGVLGGKPGTGVIEELSADTLRFSLTLNAEPPPRTPLRLAVGFPRPIQLRRLLRDCASLGLAAVDLVAAELGEKSYRSTKLLEDGGARAAFIEGAAQARDTRLPLLAVYPGLAAWLSARPWEAAPPPGEAAPPVPLLAAADNVRPQGSFAALPGLHSSAVLAVGSERGWSGREREMLEGAGFLRLSLGSRALRTETACVAAAALIMEKIGAL